MNCKRCGECCRQWFVFVEKNEPDTNDWLRWHGLDVKRMHKGTAVGGNAKCEQLRSSKDGFKCAVYDNRPMICREFLCERAR